jgi:hypothetical protein
MTESILVLRPEVVSCSFFIEVLIYCGKIAQLKHHSQSKPFQIESALKDPRIDG